VRYVQAETDALLFKLIWYGSIGVICLVSWWAIRRSNHDSAETRVRWLRAWFIMGLVLLSIRPVWKVTQAFVGIVQDWRDWLG